MNKFIVIFIFLSSLFSGQAQSCECIKADAETGMQHADRVFSASIVATKVSGKWVDIEISRPTSLKGGKPPNHLRTPLGKSACGQSIKTPETYIFFTNFNGDFDSCGATAELASPGMDALRNKIESKNIEGER